MVLFSIGLTLSKTKSAKTDQNELLSYCYEEASSYYQKEWSNLAKEWNSNNITFGEFEQRSTSIGSITEQMRENCLKNYSDGYKSFLIQQDERNKKTKSELVK